MAEGAALQAAGLFARGLPSNPPVAEDVALAAVLAGWAVGTTGLAVHHALCQTIVREVGAPHAQTNAVMLPHTVAFMSARAPVAVAALAGVLGAAGDDPAAAAAKVTDLAALAGPRTLVELGVSEDRVPAIAAAAAAHPGMGGTPGGVTEKNLLGLLAQAL